MCSEAFYKWTDIVIEASEYRSALVADLKVRSIWKSQIDGLLDTRMVDSDAPSYRNKPVQDVLSMAEKE